MLLALLTVFQVRAADLTGGGRWLLIFDTSSTMKKMQPGTEAAIRDFFTSNADGQLQAGDSVAIWGMNQQVNAQFPTFSWASEQTGLVITNLIGFLHSQKYSGSSQLATLKTPMNNVVNASKRLTILLFTDGQSEIAGTTYDDGINQMFRDVRADRAKDGQPVVVVMRSQFGQYTGCTIGFPPSPLNFPPFPAPPASPITIAPPKPVVAPANFPSLMIVGKQVSTNGIEPPPLIKAIATPMTNPPAVSTTQAVVLPKSVATNPVVETVRATTEMPVAVLQTSPPPPAATTSPVIVAKTDLAAGQATNSAAAIVATPPDNSRRHLVFVGAGILIVAAVALGLWLVRSRRLPQSSLISSTMEDDQHRH